MSTDNHQDQQKLVQLKGVGFRAGGKNILADISWSLLKGQNWAVLGGNGAGKTTFLRLVRGDIWPAPGDHHKRRYFPGGRAQASPLGFKQATGYVSSELLDTYKRREWNLSGFKTVCTGFWDTPLLYQQPVDWQLEQARRTLALMGVENLAEQSILTMSQGQAKKVLIARALVRKPSLLVLDEPCDGLDPASRDSLLNTLDAVAKSGTQLLYSTHRQDELVPATSHALILQGGVVAAQGELAEVLASPAAACFVPPAREETITPPPKPAGPTYDHLVRIKDAEVTLDGARVLKKFDWLIKPGQNWMILGPNGAGKTSLLKLLSGDYRPGLGGSISWFDLARRPTMWDLRKRISLVSAALQAQHFRPQRGLEAVTSGLFGSIGLPREFGKEHMEQGRRHMEDMGLSSLASRDVTTLSYGQLRKILIARATIIQPEILLLDEPLAGLDAPSRAEVADLLQKLARAGVCLVCVTHHPGEMAGFMSHAGVLSQGELVFQGSLDQYQDFERNA
jgi:molybdate transport system ATP-binding protein